MDIWGILNVTPDSFSDGGRYRSLREALAHAKEMKDCGAHVIDVGGESTRPAGKTYAAGFTPVSTAEELARVIPVIEELARELHIRVSVDTTKAEVARQAVAAGATIVNDVSCAAHDDLLRVVSASKVDYVLMHNRAHGQVHDTNTLYANVTEDVLAELSVALHKAESLGIERERIWIDPGLGFAKTPQQSRTLLQNLPRFMQLGQRLLLGASRKTLIDALAQETGLPPASTQHRLGGSIAIACIALASGCHALRVHDVQPTAQALALYRSITT